MAPIWCQTSRLARNHEADLIPGRASGGRPAKELIIVVEIKRAVWSCHARQARF